MRTNLERALNGVDLAHSALGGEATSLAPENYETGLVDALVNLLHFARRYDIDFDVTLATARDHHAAESRFAWDAVPDEAAPECEGHPAGPFDPTGATVYCDGSCRG